jgi:phosphoribosylanthranilate isomerase
MKIKVCGITSVEQLEALQQFKVDYAGLIFYPKSARYAGEKLEDKKEAIRNLTIKKVGVFVNAELEEVKRKIKDFGLTAVQLHGDESPDYCKELMATMQVIKVFRVGEAQNLKDRIEPYKSACHYYLFDTDTKLYGGSGKSFNWQLLEGLELGKPFFLSGGIGPEDVSKLKMFQNPFVEVVDINSCFETSPGIKNMDAVAQFVKSINADKWKK